MRAFMSDPDRRRRAALDLWLRSTLQGAAVLEAQAILGVTERGCEYQPALALASIADSSSAPRTDCARVALAEALAAFIEEGK